MTDESAGKDEDSPPQARSILDLVRDVQAAPDNLKAVTDLGLALLHSRRPVEAETIFRNAIALDPKAPFVYSNHAIALERLGRFDEAIAEYRRAVEILPRCRGQVLLSQLLCSLKRFDEALALWSGEIERSPYDPIPRRECWKIALAADRLEEAAAFAEGNAMVRWATRFWPERRDDHPLAAQRFPPPTDLVVVGRLKAPKLRHDIEQLTYLKERGVFGSEIDPVVLGMERALERLKDLDPGKNHPYTPEEQAEIGPYYSRILHVASSPRVARALSDAFDMTAIEADYIDHPPGIVFVDRLLSEEALASLRRFCLESTVWSGTMFENGYLQANFFNGFTSPLLLQIAEELRAAMPRVIGDRPLMKMWGFKYDQQMGGINIHADEAAVNVNFWITPDDANLEPDSGGLVVYGAEAPLEWSFQQYNSYSATDHIERFLKEANPRVVTVPYRQNRAVIFDSDLFHTTAPIHFKPGYENRRINVTMLYGDRTDRRQR